MKLLWILVATLFTFSNAQDKQCTERGGCTCDCSWVHSPSDCGGDDGSCCYACCCNSGPNPPPSPSNHTMYCPSASDLIVAYNTTTTPTLHDQGWTIKAGGGVASKSSFNLLGGYVEYDIDFSGVPRGVNANIYSISPENIGGGYVGDDYCDGADNTSPWCVEVDWIESNGDCGGATTLHTIPGPGNGCTAWGCRTDYMYNGKSQFHMKVAFTGDGKWTTYMDGQPIANLDPAPQASDWAKLAQQYSQRGAVIYSSQWVGWVPVDACGTNPGPLDQAKFDISNLKVYGTVMQGPTPTRC